MYHVLNMPWSVLLNNTIKPDHQYGMIFLCFHISVMFALKIRKQRLQRGYYKIVHVQRYFVF